MAGLLSTMGLQDWLVIGLAVLGIGFAWWLHRRAAGKAGCASCPMAHDHLGKADRR